MMNYTIKDVGRITAFTSNMHPYDGYAYEINMDNGEDYRSIIDADLKVTKSDEEWAKFRKDALNSLIDDLEKDNGF